MLLHRRQMSAGGLSSLAIVAVIWIVKYRPTALYDSYHIIHVSDALVSTQRVQSFYNRSHSMMIAFRGVEVTIEHRQMYIITVHTDYGVQFSQQQLQKQRFHDYCRLHAAVVENCTTRREQLLLHYDQ